MTAQRVAVLGGGMAGLAAAWRLSRPDGPGHEVTVYQRGWRLGGKGASSRGGEHARIEEHGLHVWLGYYDNAFRLMRECYGELDRPRTDPGAPIRTWRDAFQPASTIGLGEEDADGWHAWVARFPEDDRLPGEPGAGDGSFDLAAAAGRAAALVSRFAASLDTATPPPPRAVLSSRAAPPPTSAVGLLDAAAAVGAGLRAVAGGGLAARRAGQLVDLLTTLARGVVADRLVERGYGTIDHLDFGEWLRSHGAMESTVAGPFVQGMYDLAFAYEHGERSRPRFSAAVGLVLSGRTFLDYKGALFWKMRAGMGDVVFAPLHDALVARGVRFAFFHRLDDVELDPEGRAVQRVRMGRQVAVKEGPLAYRPLSRVKGLPVFADRPDLDQLVDGAAITDRRFESHWCAHPDDGEVVLEAGVDFDHVVLAVPVGMHRHSCPSLVAADPRWATMSDRLGTVATQALQLWLEPDERSLGWRHDAGSLTGCGTPLDTYASMSQTLAFEAWEGSDAPRTAASFCAVLPERDAGDATDGDPTAEATARVRAGADAFLDGKVERIWPNAVGDDGFRRDLVHSDYVRANVDPSDRYVQSLPGTMLVRMRADGSGYAGLALAGDWIDNGLGAGCIESAVLGGLQAANAVEGADLTAGTTGFAPLGDARG